VLLLSLILLLWVAGGLFEWWADLEREYAEVRGTLASGIAGKESAHYSEAMQILQVYIDAKSEELLADYDCFDVDRRT
jgi:hypothetical protein